VCHAENGMGGIGLPLNGTKIEHFPRDYLFKTIRLGREGRVMPAFDLLSDAQVNAIVDHILSWKKGSGRAKVFSPEPVKGDVAKGNELYLDKCAKCHGKDGKSQGVGTGVTIHREREFEVLPPALNNPGFLASATDQWIRETVIEGRLGTSMPPREELKLSDSDINDIVAYVRSFESNYIGKEAEEREEPTMVFDSPYDFTTTVTNIKQALQGRNFRLFPERYMEMGLVQDTFVNKRQLSLRFCNFAQLYTMINTEPRLGVVLPCRITIVEGEDGQVRMYVMNMKLVSRLYNNEQLNDYANTMQETLLQLIEEATL
jgi:cytochrome c oxidase cbb3-type subunit 3